MTRRGLAEEVTRLGDAVERAEMSPREGARLQPDSRLVKNTRALPLTKNYAVRERVARRMLGEAHAYGMLHESR